MIVVAGCGWAGDPAGVVVGKRNRRMVFCGTRLNFLPGTTSRSARRMSRVREGRNRWRSGLGDAQYAKVVSNRDGNHVPTFD